VTQGDVTPTPPGSDETLGFVLRQGPLRGLLRDPLAVDEHARTTATLPPRAARGPLGRPLPTGTWDLLAAARYPDGRAAAPRNRRTLPGHVLTLAFGLQRREPSNPANDHRAVASVRSKFPVHVLVIGPDGAAGYLDVYLSALVDLDVDPAVVEPLRPASGGLRIVLAARHTDFPAFYGILRCALADLEVGINARSLTVAAQLFGVPAEVQVGGPLLGAARDLLAACGTGSWSAPVIVTLRDLEPMPWSELLHGYIADRYDAELDALLEAESAHASLRECAPVIAPRYAEQASPQAPAESIPALPPGTGTDWSRVVWNRSAGRVPRPLTGFSARPATTDRPAVEELLAWVRTPAPAGPLRELGAAVTVHAVIQNTEGLESGCHVAEGGSLRLVTADATLPARLEAAFGYPLTAANDCGVRHALSLWYFTVDIERLIAEGGAAAWGLLNVWCGWAVHGLSIGAAAQGLFARPARSFDEHHVTALLRLPRQQCPVVMVVVGRARYTEPALDLRS
jgi:hypothetical protein